MNIIAVKKTTEVVPVTFNEEFELFELTPMESEDGSTVNVKKSIGVFTLDRLNNEKKGLEQQMSNLIDYIKSIDEKINIINSINK